MCGKHNYNNKKVIDRIEKHKDFTTSSEVIYALDKDDFHINYRDQEHIKKVENYCKNKGYHIVWFVKNIEDVFLQHTPNNKRSAAIRFRKTKQIKNIDINNLNNPNPQQRYKSNIKCVFDKVLKSY